MSHAEPGQLEKLLVWKKKFTGVALGQFPPPGKPLFAPLLKTMLAGFGVGHHAGSEWAERQ